MPFSCAAGALPCAAPPCSPGLIDQSRKWLLYMAANWNTAATWRPANQRPCSALTAACAAGTDPNLRYTKPCNLE